MDNSYLEEALMRVDVSFDNFSRVLGAAPFGVWDELDRLIVAVHREIEIGYTGRTITNERS